MQEGWVDFTDDEEPNYKATISSDAIYGPLKLGFYTTGNKASRNDQ